MNTREQYTGAIPHTAAELGVYKQLCDEMDGTSHGGLFTPRPLDDDPYSLMYLEKAYIPARELDRGRLDWLRQEILFQWIVKPDSYNAFLDRMDEVTSSKQVTDHLEANGSIVFVSGHISYADIVIMMAGSTDVGIRHDKPDPTQGQHAITSRLISIFKMPLLKDGIESGYVVDDALLHLGGVLQTVPASATGSRVKNIAGNDINEPVRRDLHTLLNKGQNKFFLAASGTQDKPNKEGTQLVMDTVSRGTVTMLTQPNKVKGAERLLAIPVFLDCNPFEGGSFNGASDASFEILPPRFLYSEEDVTTMMEGIASKGTVEKKPGTLPLIYKKPSVRDKIAKLTTGSAVYKD